MHQNHTRSSALNNLIYIVSTLKSAASALVEACENPQLFSPNFSQPSAASEVDIDLSDAVSLAVELGREQKLVETSLKIVIARLNRIRNSSKSLVPVHKLPTELLSYVFLLGQGTLPHDFHIPLPSGPLCIPYEDHISQVCGIWRYVSIKTANLWRYIDYRLPSSHRRAGRLLERSGSCMLSIYLFPISDATEPFRTFLIIPTFKRCYSLSLTPTRNEHMVEFVSWMQTISPQLSLKKIHLSYRQLKEFNSLPSADEPLMTLMQGCSDKFIGVTDLCIECISFPQSYMSQQNATFLQNITTLHFTLVSIYEIDFRTMLWHCYRLKSLRLQNCGSRQRGGEDLELELPLLRHLTVVESYLFSLGFWKNIALPSLESLTIAHEPLRVPCRHAIEFFSSALISSVSRTSVQLMGRVPTVHADTVEYLQPIPVMGELRVHVADRTAVRNKEGVWTRSLDIFMEPLA
jgi:hypothetical protein